ncbi:hypothetical protein MMC27_005284 [Xylographa pallens]|nr:hypothetical protein [Xylographa pallens]
MDHSSLDAPEVRRDSRPEVLWDPLEYPPEVELGQGIETPYDGLEHHGEKQPEPAVRIRTRLSWRWLSVVALTFAAIIGGSIGGVLSKRPSSTSPSPTASQASSSQPPTSSATGSSVPHTILRNTSIASTTCPNGDRWIFFQDISGSIRQAQYPSDVATWRVASNGTIPSIPRAGTPLSATCVEVTSGFQQEGSDFSSSSLSYEPGTGVWVSIIPFSSLTITVIYLDASNAIRRVILSYGSWQDYATGPTLFTPANNTKLSSSSILEPLILGERTTNTTHFASTMLYQSTNGSIVMANLDPLVPNNTDSSSGNPPINPNIITAFMSSGADEVSNPSTSLSCIYNRQTADLSLQFFTACYIAETMDAWFYNQSDISQIKGMATFNQSAHATGNSQNATKEVNLVALDGPNLAIVSLLPNQTIMSSIILPYVHSTNLPQTPLSAYLFERPSSWSTQIPFDHISATSVGRNSTLIYVYYQANDSSLAEIYYDTANVFWPSVPTFIVVP